MSHEIHFSSPESPTPEKVSKAVTMIESQRHILRATMDERGGLKRDDLRDAMVASARKLGLDTESPAHFERTQLDFSHRSGRYAISLQAGRAAVNNDALLSVLAAASARAIDWLIIVLPHSYKNGKPCDKVLDQLQALAQTTGIDIDIKGVVVVGF